MLCSRFQVFLVLLLAAHSSCIRPRPSAKQLDTEQKGNTDAHRFKAVLDTGSERAFVEARGYDLSGVTSQDANPYVKTYRAMLTDIGNLLTEHKITWHITFGTLIGYERMKKFLPYDEDIDIYVANNPFQDQKAFDLFQSAVVALFKGYSFTHVGGPVYRVTKDKTKDLILDSRGRGPDGEGTWIDIYEYGSCDKDKSTCDGFEVPHARPLDMSKLLPTKECTIDEVKALCPKDSDYLLSAYYGEWRKAKKQYCQGQWKDDCSTKAAPTSSLTTKATTQATTKAGSQSATTAKASADIKKVKELIDSKKHTIIEKNLKGEIDSLQAALHDANAVKLEARNANDQIAKIEKKVQMKAPRSMKLLDAMTA